MSFVASALQVGSCIADDDFCGVEDFRRGEILLPLSQRDLDYLQDVGYSQAVRVFSSDLFWAYLAFTPALEDDWDSDGNFRWLPYNANKVIVSGIPGKTSRRVSILLIMN